MTPPTAILASLAFVGASSVFCPIQIQIHHNIPYHQCNVSLAFVGACAAHTLHNHSSIILDIAASASPQKIGILSNTNTNTNTS